MKLSRQACTTGAVPALGLASHTLARAAVLPVDAVRADFDEQFDGLARAHFDLYANRSRREHRAEHARLRRRLGPGTTLEEAIGIFQRFVAFGRIAHARIDAAGDVYRAYRKSGGRIFPLTLRV